MRKLFYTLLIMVVPVLCTAETVLYEDFEAPDVAPGFPRPSFTDQTIPTGWEDGNQGFGNGRNGIDNIQSGEFTTLDTNANKQAFSFRYTNTGLASPTNGIGGLDTLYAKYTVSFQAFIDGGNDELQRFQLIAWSPDETLSYRAFDSTWQNYSDSVILAESVSTSSETITNGQIVTITYISDPVLDAGMEGWDLRIRTRGATGSANIDNVVVTYTPLVTYVKEINKVVVINGKLFVPGGSTPRVVTFWTPAELDTVAWYDAYSSASFGFGVGNKVSAWYDKSGNSNDMEQASGGNQPTLIAADPLVNALPSVYSEDSVSEYLTTVSTVPENIKRAYFVCYYADGVTNTFNNHNAIFAGVGVTRLTGRSNDSEIWDNQDASNFDLNGATYRNGFTNNVAPPNTLGTLPCPATLWRTTASGSYAGESWRVLANNTASWASWWGGLSEIIFTDGSEDLETQQKVEGYLAWKWGLQGELPSYHPYKNRRP